MGVLALALGVLTVAAVVAALARLCLRLPVRLRGGVRRAGAPDLRRRTGRRRRSAQCGRAQLDLVQRRADDRPRGRRRDDRRASGAGWAFLVNGASFVAVLISLSLLRASELRPNARAEPRQGRLRRGAPLCAEAPRPHDDPGHAVPDRHVRPQLPDLHLDDGGQRLPRRRARLRAAVFDHGDRHGGGRAAGGQPQRRRLRLAAGRRRRLRVRLHAGCDRARAIGCSPPRSSSSARPR